MVLVVERFAVYENKNMSQHGGRNGIGILLVLLNVMRGESNTFQSGATNNALD